jgi:NIPSNAP
MITCFIRYDIDPFKTAAFEEYARNWGQAIPRNGAELIGYYAPHEGSGTTAYGLYNIEDLPPMRSTAPVCAPIPRAAPTMNSRRRSSSSAMRTVFSCGSSPRRTQR